MSTGKPIWSHGEWSETLGIERGLQGCEGKTIAVIVKAKLYRNDPPYRDCKVHACSYKGSAFVKFTDGTRRLLETGSGWRATHYLGDLVKAGFLTPEEERRLKESIVLVMVAEERGWIRREQARKAAEAVYRAIVGGSDEAK